MMAVMRAGTPGGKTDDRLYQVRSEGLEGGTPSLGGFLLQTDFSQELIGSLYRPGNLPSLVRKFPVSSNANKMSMPGFDKSSRADGSRWGGIRGFWTGEGGEKTASKPKFRKIEMSLVKLTALCYTTDEMVEDVNQPGTYLRDAFEAEFTFKLSDVIINGTGSGQPLGILTSNCIVSITKETSQTADTILWENVKKMIARFRPMDAARAVWVGNINILSQLLSMAQVIGTAGVPVYTPANANVPNRLCGWPIIFDEASPTLGDKGDLILMDPSAYLLIDKGGVQAAVSIHVRFIYDESVFSFVYRCNGQPMFASAITPFKGTADTVSPFVAIAERT